MRVKLGGPKRSQYAEMIVVCENAKWQQYAIRNTQYAMRVKNTQTRKMLQKHAKAQYAAYGVPHTDDLRFSPGSYKGTDYPIPSQKRKGGRRRGGRRRGGLLAAGVLRRGRRVCAWRRARARARDG